MTLATLGDRVSFEMTDGRRVYAGTVRDALMYDADGVVWPCCSLLVGPFVPGTRRVTSESKWILRWFGKRHELRRGTVDVPPRAMRGWRSLGPARRAFYDRIGTDGQKPPGPKQHPINEPSMWDLFERKKPPVILYVRGVFLRLELPSWCTIDGRGIARP